MKKIKCLRVLGLALGLACLTGLAQAQTENTLSLPKERLACLQRPERVPDLKTRNNLDKRKGFVRARLRFTAPDKAPEVELLRAVADEEMQQIARSFLAQYRLPCLLSNDPPIEAVQEFDFAVAGLPVEPIPLAVQRNREACVVLPPERMEMGVVSPPRKRVNVLIHGRFDGDGKQAPTSEIAFSNAGDALADMVLAYVSKYRMPCRKAGESAYEFSQVFAFAPSHYRAFGFKREDFRLIEFLGLIKDPENLIAKFDLDTMSCPFRVRFNIYQPQLPNEVEELDAPDANRAAFLNWLAGLQIKFRTKQMADDLFGNPLHITVPCGSLNLAPAAAP